MTALHAPLRELLDLGAPGRHPAGAILGVAGPPGTDVVADGWAALPEDGSPGTPMAPGTWLDWASVTKVAATTVLVLRLVDEGALDFADPVVRFLPAFTGEGRDDVRVEDLLTHTSGLPPWWPLYCLTTDAHEAVDRVCRMPLRSRPGDQYVYSDLGMVLAGALLEPVTGSPLAESFRGLVADPLGLSLRYGPVDPAFTATSADSDTVEWSMVATGRPYPVDTTPDAFSGWREGPVRGGANDGNAAHALGGVSGHAGLFGPVRDLLTLGTALCENELAHPEVLERFTRPTPAHPAQAVGFRRRTSPGADGHPSTWLWHGGFTGTVWALDPRTRTVVAGGATRLHGTTGALPRDDGPGGRDDLPDPLAGLATGEEIATLVLSAAPTPTPQETSR